MIKECWTSDSTTETLGSATGSLSRAPLAPTVVLTGEVGMPTLSLNLTAESVAPLSTRISKIFLFTTILRPFKLNATTSWTFCSPSRGMAATEEIKSLHSPVRSSVEILLVTPVFCGRDLKPDSEKQTESPDDLTLHRVFLLIQCQFTPKVWDFTDLRTLSHVSSMWHDVWLVLSISPAPFILEYTLTLFNSE